VTFRFWRATELRLANEAIPDWGGDDYACHTVLFEPAWDAEQRRWCDEPGCCMLIDGHEKVITEYWADPEAGGYPRPGKKGCYVGVLIGP